MLGNQQCEVRVLRLLVGTLIAVSVYGNNSIRVLIYHDTMRIHAEGSDRILKLFGTVHDLALIKLIRQMGKNNRRKFNTHTDIDTVRLGIDL